MTTEQTTDESPEEEVPADMLAVRRKVLETIEAMSTASQTIADGAMELTRMGVPTDMWMQALAGRMSPTVRKLVEWASPYLSPAIGVLATSQMKEGVHNVSIEDAVKAGAGLDQNGTRGLRNLGPDPQGVDWTMARRAAHKVLLAEAQGSAAPVMELVQEGLPIFSLAEGFLCLDQDLINQAESAHAVRMRELVGRLFEEAPKMENFAGGVDLSQRPALMCSVVVRGLQHPLSGVLSTTEEGTLKLMTPVRDSNAPHAAPKAFIEQFFDYADVLIVALEREIKVSGAAPSSGIILQS